jgi:hypothetical protein
VAVGLAGGGAEGLVGGDEGLALEGAADEVDQARGQVGEVAEGAVLDGAARAVGLAQEVADVGLALMLPFDLGHMDGGGFLSHSDRIGIQPG